MSFAKDRLRDVSKGRTDVSTCGPEDADVFIIIQILEDSDPELIRESGILICCHCYDFRDF